MQLTLVTIRYYSPSYLLISELVTVDIFRQKYYIIFLFLLLSCYNYTVAEPGCSQCHRGITIGDWRDPLDPDLDAQVIFSQFNQGKSTLQKKYLPGECKKQ